jgi:hypothetical protein
MRAMDGRISWGTLATSTFAGCLLALASTHASAGTPVRGNFQVSVRVLPSPAESASALDAVPAPAGALRLTRTVSGDSYWIDGDATAVSRRYREAMTAKGYRLVWQSGDGRASTWHHARQRVDIELHDVLGSRPATRVVVQATPAS